MAGELAAKSRASSRQLAALKLLRRRLIQAVPLILGVVVINFCLIQLAPGSFLELMTAENQVSDPAKRRELVFQFEKIITVEAPLLPLVELESITVASTKVQSHSNDPNYLAATWYDIWLAS